MAEQSEDFATAHLEADVIDGHEVAEALHELVDDDGGKSFGRLTA